MSTRVIRTGNSLDIPISGGPTQMVEAGPAVRSAAVLGADFVGMKPTMLVAEGDRVRLGTPIFEDKKTPGVRYVAPGAGVVRSIARGPKRRFDALVIDLEGDEAETFPSYDDHFLGGLARKEVRDQIVRAGLWPALRTRPYGKTPTLDSEPHSIFVTVMDSNPLAAEAKVVLQEPEYERFFVHGVQALSTLTEGKLYLCRSAGAKLPDVGVERAESVAFDGPHPAGLPGTHIHFLDPVNAQKTVWHIGYQDVIAIGRLFLTGQLSAERIVSLAGPAVKKPRLLRTQLGASLSDLTADELEGGKARIISGSVLSGRASDPELAYLGRFDTQVSVIFEGGEREMFGWAAPGGDRFSLSRAFLSAFNGQASAPRALNSSMRGSRRAVVPIGLYEKVMPLDIIATPLLKALLVHDSETAQALGCLELEEEDLALCTFVCPGKNEYGPLLRESLTTIEREG